MRKRRTKISQQRPRQRPLNTENMALNCSMITPTNDPIPLPGEKFFLSVKSVTIYLNPTRPGAGTTSEAPTSPSNTNDAKMKGKLSLGGILSTISGNPKDGSSNGTIYVTNQRILFVADNASELPDTVPSDGTVLPVIKTLTVPLRNSFDGRFVQPWLSPNYHLSTFTPVPNGNLDQLLSLTGSDGQSSTAPDSFTLKVVFNEGHGFEFYEALEEVKNRLFLNEGTRSAELEELPIYSPPAGNSMPLEGVGPSTISENDAEVTNVSTNEDLPPPIDESVSREFLRRNTVPEDDLLLAASIATQEELQEGAIVTEEPPMITVADSQSHLSHSTPVDADEPPVYEP